MRIILKNIVIAFCILLTSAAKIYGQCQCNNVTDANCLKSCLDGANAGDVITITADIDLSSLTNQGDLPLSVPYGVTLTGNYHPVTNTQGTMIYHNSYRWNYNSNNKAKMFLLQMKCVSGGSCSPAPCSTTIKNIRLRGASRTWQEFNSARFACNNTAPDTMNDKNQFCGGIYINGESSSTCFDIIKIEDCEIFGFNRAAVESYGNISNILIKNSYIHHAGGSGFVGIGYGVWARMAIQSNSNCTFTIENTIFDDCKDAIDGTSNSDLYPMHWNFQHITLNHFAGGINRHNNSGGMPYVKNLNPNTFYYRNEDCNSTLLSGCFDNVPSIQVCDKSPGNITVEHSIFHNDGINLPIPGANDGTVNFPFTLTVRDNTFVSERRAAYPSCTTAQNGYLRVSDNYVENSTFNYERSSNPPIFNNSGNENYFSYIPGQQVPSPYPQPPYVTAVLQNSSQHPLPPVVPGSNIVYTSVNSPITIQPYVSNSSVNGQTFIIRTNSANRNQVGSGNTSGDNHFFDEELYSNTSSAPPVFNGFNKPGLYGIDIMGFDNSSRHASSWYHLPVVALPPNPSAIDKILIFHIKDSYQQFHHDQLLASLPCGNVALPSTFGTNVTGIYKQVELNGQAIWREDIAQGGDGWERITVDLSQPNALLPLNAIPLTLLHTNGTPNTITFSIAMDNDANNQIDVRLINGLLMWVDDVYLKGSGSISCDNLIPDGTIENSWDGTDLPVSNPTLQSSWYRNKDIDIPKFQFCSPQVFGVTRWKNDESDIDNQTTLINSACGTPATIGNAQVGSAERKSGRQALQLKIPRFSHQSPLSCNTYSICNDYIDPSGFTSVIGASTDFDVTDLFDCTEYASYLADPPHNFEDLASLFPAQNSFSDRNFYLDQDLTISSGQTLELIGCYVAIHPGVTITVEQGGALQCSLFISGSYKRSTHFFACRDMWQGIVNNGGTIIMHGGTEYRHKIEDAITAITSDGGMLRLKDAIFDKNASDLLLSENNYSFNQNFSIVGCRFLNSQGLLLKEPLSGNFKSNSISIQNISSPHVNIGSATSTLFNIISDCFIGILIINSNADVINTKFERIYNKNGFHHAVNCGSAVYVDNRVNRTVSIGKDNNGAFAGNIFKDVNIGIYANLGKSCRLDVAGNKFSNSNYNEGSGSSFYNTAITVQSRESLNSTVNAYGNEITDCRIGIHGININKLRIGGYDANGIAQPNTISYHTGTNAIVDFHHAIWLQRCNNADVLENTITNNTPTPEANLRGINIENCQNANIGCNNITNMGRAMRFEGDCTGMPGTQLIKNNMTDYEIGIELDLAQLPNQGTTGDPWDNTWSQLLNPNTKLKVAGQLLQPIPIVWYFQGTDGDVTDIHVPSPRGANIINPFELQPLGTVDCANSSRIGDFDRDERFGAVVGDSAEYVDFENELSYAAKTSVYEALKQNDSLLTLGLPTDASFQQFFDEMSETNIGMLSEVKTAIDSNEINTAAFINETVNDTNSIEYCRKALNSILTEKVLQDMPLTAADTATLEYIYAQHWINAGDAVYEAAAVLSREYHSPLISFRKKPNSEPEKPKTPLNFNKVEIYPNPANNMLYVSGLPVESCWLEIYDSFGRLVYRKINNAKSVSIDLLHYSEGIYNLNIKNNTSEYFNTHFVVLK
jgi:hypothetical protein